MEMPIARQMICLASTEVYYLNQEGSLEDINGYTAASGRCMTGRVFLCNRRNLYNWQICVIRNYSYYQHFHELKRRFNYFLVRIVLNEFMFILAAAIVFFITFLHSTLTAGFGLIMLQTPISQFTHAVMHMHCSPNRSAEVNKC